MKTSGFRGTAPVPGACSVGQRPVINGFLAKAGLDSNSVTSAIGDLCVATAADWGRLY
jgi:hypothetical protein